MVNFDRPIDNLSVSSIFFVHSGISLVLTISLTDNSNVNQALHRWSTVWKYGWGSVQLGGGSGTVRQSTLMPGWVFRQNDTTDIHIKNTDAPATTYNKITESIIYVFKQGVYTRSEQKPFAEITIRIQGDSVVF